MDQSSSSRQNDRMPPPTIRQPVDSHHRLVRETHGLNGHVRPVSGVYSTSSLSRSNSRRLTVAASRSEHDAQAENVSSFFDPDRLAISTAQATRGDPTPPFDKIRWPFLGSVRSRGSRSAPPSPRAESFASRPRTGEPDEMQLPWRPLFLHRRLLIAFSVLFVALFAGLQAALQISEHTRGFGMSSDAARYPCQYSIVLVLTITAATWARVEFQAASSMPWIRMLNSQVTADKSLLLDYVSLSEPHAVVKAVGNKDWIVASTATVGLLLKIIIIFSCALITPKIITDPAHESTVSLDDPQNSLSVRPVPAYLITALLGLGLVLTISTAVIVPSQGFLPRDPTTLVGLASVMAHSHPLVESLQGMGAATKEAMQARLQGSTYSSGAEGHAKLGDSNLGYFHVFGGKAPPRHLLPRRFDSSRWRRPVPLHGLIRLLYIVVLCAVILGFEITLRASQRFGGLRTINGDIYYMAWTAVPALVLLPVANYMLTVDWWTRLLAPFAHLSRRGNFDKTIGLNLVNTSSLVTLWKAWTIRDIAVLAATLGGLTASLLIVASAALFELVPVESRDNIALRTNDFFASSLANSSDDPICTGCTNDTTLASLILGSNASYPLFTFADLNLPGMELEDDDHDDDLKIAVRLTAIRPNMTCRLYRSDEITTNLTLDVTVDDEITDPLYVDVPNEACRGNGSNAIIRTARKSTDSDIFGVGLRRNRTSPQCSDWLYVWGKLAGTSGNDRTVSINALACNETIESVETDVTLHGPVLRVEPAHAPVPDERTAKNTFVAIPELNYSSLIENSTDGLLDPFFTLLDASGFVDAGDAFGDESTKAARGVQSAILHQHGIIRAQSINFKSRRHLSSSGTFPSADGQNIVSGVDPEAPVSRAVPIISGSLITKPIRLRQDPVATRILQGLLGSVLLLHIVCWIFTRGSRIPRPPTTIASTTALLVDGNLLKLLPRGAQWQDFDEIKTTFGEGGAAQHFEMGWESSRLLQPAPRRKPREDGTFGIRAVDPVEWAPEEVEMRPIPPKKSREYLRPAGRVGKVRRGRAALGTDTEQIKSVMVGKGDVPLKKKKSVGAWSGPKELVKVWWSAS